MYTDRPSGQGVAQETAGGELVGQGQVGADEGEAARDYAVEAGLEQQGFAALLEPAIGRNRGRVGGEVFGKPIDMRRLMAIHRAGTRVKHAAHARRLGKVDEIGTALQAALDDRRTASADSCGAWCGEVDQVVEVADRKLEPGRLADDPLELGAQSEVGDFGPETHRIAAEQGGADIRAQAVIGGNDGFQQPLAVEARGAGDEESRAGKLRPKLGRVPQDVLAILDGNGRQRRVQKPTPRNSRIRSAA